MNYWEILEDRDDYGRGGFGMREGDEAERAYREGCRHGYEKARQEMMGQRGGYGERRMMPPYYPEYPMGMRGGDYDYEDMGQRRRRRPDGQYM